MALKQVDLTRLKSTLITTGLQVKDPPLFQVIDQLIQQSRFLTDQLDSISGGSPGITGADGKDGQIGPPGMSGRDGMTGVIGPQGISGIDGVTGAAGPLTIGPMGLNGRDGINGFPIPGPVGDTGAIGNTGPAGPLTIGPMGLNGSNGLNGFPIPGPKGDTGSSGINLLRTTANQTINAGAGVYVDITDLTFPVVNGVTYSFKFYIVWQSAATTTGQKCSVNCPTGTLDFFALHQTIANSATVGVATHTQRHSVTRDDLTTLTSTIAAGVDLVTMIEGRYICTADGTFAARFASELAANTDIVVQEGSWGMYW